LGFVENVDDVTATGKVGFRNNLLENGKDAGFSKEHAKKRPF
jgi:hypothetical protein